MYTPETLGSLLRRFRLRLGGRRHTVEWLARSLGYPVSAIYGWECGDPSKGLPSRATILSIGRLYGLCPDETNQLIEACAAQRKRPADKARYEMLSPEELSEWAPFIAPEASFMSLWVNQLHIASEAYLDGELRTARRLAESVLQSIRFYGSDEREARDWNDSKREEIAHVWFLAWRRFFEATALLETGSTAATLLAPYLVWARAIASGVNDARLAGLAVYMEGDFYHLQGKHRQALGYHYDALRRQTGSGWDPTLRAMIQRLIILDGSQVLTRDQLIIHVRAGRRLADELSNDEFQARSLLLEAVGRALGMIGDSDCWDVLADAESDPVRRFPVGYVTTLYSRLIALTSTPREVDRDQLEHVANVALAAATHGKWARRVQQIMEIANSAEITIPVRA